MQKNALETIVGFIILSIATAFFVFAYKTAGASKHEIGYNLNAKFQSAEGIVEGSDVMLAGIKIGTVSKLELDHDTFVALMKINIDKGVKLPKDSQAAIVSSGFLGGKFVAIIPGGEPEDLQNNDQITLTQSSVNLESLIGKFMYSFSSSGK